MTNFARQIENHMPVVCTDGTELGKVDRLEGDISIKLTRDENGQHHWIPIGWVTNVENGEVKIDRSVAHAKDEWADSNPEEL